MNKEQILQQYDTYKSIMSDHNDEPNKYSFVSEWVFNITTYDDYLAIKFGKNLIEILKVIYEQKNFEYIKNEENYEKFIIYCNLIGMINWGTSIRGCWFEYEIDKYSNIDDEETMKWFLYEFMKEE